MGKKKESDLRYTGKNAWMGSYAGKGEEKQLHKDLQKRYGIAAPRVLKMDNSGAVQAHAERMAYSAKINAAINNDYDVRRTLEAKALSGDADAREFAEGGIKGISQVNEVHKMLKKDHEARGNNPDDFGSQSDYSQMTMAAVDKDRTKQEEKLVSKTFLDEKLNSLKDRFKDEETQAAEEQPEYIESENLSAAKKRLAGQTENKSNDSMFKRAAPTEKPTTAFVKANESVPSLDDQGTAVASYLEQYKKDLAQGAGLKEDKKSNIRNAVNTIQFS